MEDKDLLLKYYPAAKDLVGRIAPCITSVTQRIETIRGCCETVVALVSAVSAEGEAVSGISAILLDVKNELYDVLEVLDGDGDER